MLMTLMDKISEISKNDNTENQILSRMLQAYQNEIQEIAFKLEESPENNGGN